MKGISIIVIRWSANKFTNSAPCKYCSEFMRNIGVKNIHYSQKDGSIYSCNIKNYKSDHLSQAYSDLSGVLPKKSLIGVISNAPTGKICNPLKYKL